MAQQRFYQDAGSFLSATSLRLALASVCQVPRCQLLKRAQGFYFLLLHYFFPPIPFPPVIYSSGG